MKIYGPEVGKGYLFNHGTLFVMVTGIIAYPCALIDTPGSPSYQDVKESITGRRDVCSKFNPFRIRRKGSSISLDRAQMARSRGKSPHLLRLRLLDRHRVRLSRLVPKPMKWPIHDAPAAGGHSWPSPGPKVGPYTDVDRPSVCSACQPPPSPRPHNAHQARFVLILATPQQNTRRRTIGFVDWGHRVAEIAIRSLPPDIADEAGPTAGFSAEVAAVATEDAATFARLKAPVKRVCPLHVPIPYSPILDDHVFPDRKRITPG
jgi:transketolase-like protein